MKLFKTRETHSGRQSPEPSPPLARERRECCAREGDTRLGADFTGTPLTERRQQPPFAIAPMTAGNGPGQGTAQMRKSRRRQDSGDEAFRQDLMPAARHARTTENVFSDYFSQLTPMYQPAPAQTSAAAPPQAQAEAEEYIPELSAFEQEAWDKEDEPFTPEQQRQELGAQVEREHARQREHLQMMIARRKQARQGKS